jgi:hypothetical protein
MERGFFASLAFVFLIAPPVYSQIPNELVTRSASVMLEEVGPYAVYISSGSCSAPDCSVSRALYKYYDSAALSSKTSISGRMKRLYNDRNLLGGCRSNSGLDIYAKVQPGRPVHIKAATTVGLTWDNNQQNIDWVSGAGITLYNSSYTVADGNGCGLPHT